MLVHFVWTKHSVGVDHEAVFVAIGRVLDEVSDVVQHLHSVDDCAKTENLSRPFEAVPGPAGCFLSREPLRLRLDYS